MILSDISIKRPVLAAVASILIVVFGLAALLSIPVRELPDVDTAVVTITTAYAGAAPEIIDTDITETIEGAVAGISGVKSISSQSRRGRSRTTVEFIIGRDIDEAANDVRSAVARVRGQLPAEVDEPQVVKNDADADPVIRLAVTSTRMSAAQITDYLDRFLVDRLATLDGVANVEIFGERRYAIRIWLDREALAARNLTVADVEAAIRRNNVELPAGDVESRSRMLAVRIDSRLADVDAFSNIVVDRVAGYPVRLKDVARVALGVEDENTLVRANGVEAVGLGISRQSQANTIAISRAVTEELERIRPTLPDGMEITVGSDDAVFIGASIREVLTALAISLVLVVLVILLFLMSVRATLVPAVTIPVSLIGCFILISALGFSINVLTLLALLLAIGLVVDDAIVVLENIQRRIDEGEPPMVASFLGARQVTFAVIATSLTLIAVFVPISFLEGQAGRLFTEFGFVMASAVAISTFVALSLCPVLASRLLRRHRGTGEDGTPPRPSRFRQAYRAVLTRALNMPLVVLTVAVAIAGGGIALYQELPRELSPSEDRGIIFIPLTSPQGSTVTYTDQEVRILEDELMPLLESGEARTVYSIVGSWGRPYRAFVIVRLAPWEEREASHTDIQRQIIPSVEKVIGARGFPVTPSGLGLRGNRTPLSVVIGGPDFESVKEWTYALLEKAQENPGLRNPEIDFEENQSQIDIALDREKLDDLGISVEAVAQTLQTMLASREVSTFVDRGREYPVILQAQADDRQTPSDIGNMFVRAGDGETLVPLVALTRLSERAAAPELNRYDRLPSITLEAALAEGYDLGSAIDFIREAAAETLPPEAKIAFSGQSQQYLETSGGVAVTFGLAVLIVFLVLAAQFESFVHPFVIMLSVPLALAGALYALFLAGLSLNIYSQIGIILLIGLMAKNGILIVEFANQLRDEGRSVREAVIEASILRFRPIVMTVISTILGAVPLVLASGAGAESRVAIGTVVIGGLALASVLTLVVTPVLYDLLARFTEPRGAVEKRLAAELPSRPKGIAG
ncbi:efflux RND transporter permease subunit [Afifella pfennigii]|uniref:efflux RND transporter permease subunit n=1 Tax=Afifella pfennigii TaxID=209897 RepID=UPI000479667A|nr:efflux RND transporter permease subunit [Afifella pfennigii]